MKKTTRKSFSRKAIIVIASVFLVISLTATGFAAWLISRDANGTGNGNVTASNVSDAILAVTVDNSDDLGTINFGPKSTDTEGQIRYDANEADDAEKLSITVTGKIGRFNTLEKMLVTVNCPDEVLIAAGYTWTEGEDARTYTYNADKAFIALPEYAMDKDGKALPKPASDETAAKEFLAENAAFTATAGGTENEKKFSFNVDFGWGALFGGNNPGRYLDGEDGLTVSETNKGYLLAIANANKGTGVSENYDSLTAEAKRDILTAMYNLLKTSGIKYTVVINAQAK